MGNRNLIVLALATSVGTGVCLGACNSESGRASGTHDNSGGGGAAGAGGIRGAGDGGISCSNVTACGGALVGTWTVSSSCLNVTGNLDLSLAGAGCASAPVTGDLEVNGTWTANPDGTYSDNTTTSGTERFTLAASCLTISSTAVTCSGAAGLLTSLGYASINCTDTTDRGCDCTAIVHQMGGIGAVVPASSVTGNYTRSGNQLTLAEDSGDTRYTYCSSQNTITMTPQPASPTITGTILLQHAAVSGSGGAIGSGGQSGSGGAVSTGGHPGTGGVPGAGGGAGSNATTMGPCDIYAASGNPCVAAHSTVRALSGTYSGKLYQVRNTAGVTKDILTMAPGGVADGGAQDLFCSGTTCVVTVVYDQSGKGNDLWYQGSAMVPGSTSSSPARATSESLTLGGHKVYSLYINPGNSYWADASKSGIALGSQPEGMYMVTSGKHFNGGCCFDYGNSETDRKADGAGAMDAINFSTITAWGTGAGSGPWVMADLEFGVFAQNNTSKNQNDPAQTSTYVSAMLKNNGTTQFALRGGDAMSGNLGTYYKGALPGGWSPMKKQGAIVLGSGGDCCKPGGGANLSDGTFYEGCIVTGYPSDATEDAVQANIVAAGYGR